MATPLQDANVLAATFGPGGSHEHAPGADKLYAQAMDQVHAAQAQEDNRIGKATAYGGSDASQAAEMGRIGGLAGQGQFNAQTAWNDQQQDRGAQTDALGMMRNAAMGLTPSVAELQGRNQLNMAMSNAASLGAGGRGAAGIALNGYNAAQNMGNISQGYVGQAQALRASELAQNLQNYGQMGLGMGAQALQGYGAANQSGLGYEGLNQNIGLGSMTANQNYLNMIGQQKQANDELEEKKREANMQTAVKAGEIGLGAVTGGAGGAVVAGGAAAAKKK